MFFSILKYLLVYSIISLSIRGLLPYKLVMIISFLIYLFLPTIMKQLRRFIKKSLNGSNLGKLYKRYIIKGKSLQYYGLKLVLFALINILKDKMKGKKNDTKKKPLNKMPLDDNKNTYDILNKTEDVKNYQRVRNDRIEKALKSVFGVQGYNIAKNLNNEYFVESTTDEGEIFKGAVIFLSVNPKEREKAINNPKLNRCIDTLERVAGFVCIETLKKGKYAHLNTIILDEKTVDEPILKTQYMAHIADKQRYSMINDASYEAIWNGSARLNYFAFLGNNAPESNEEFEFFNYKFRIDVFKKVLVEENIFKTVDVVDYRSGELKVTVEEETSDLFINEKAKYEEEGSFDDIPLESFLENVKNFPVVESDYNAADISYEEIENINQMFATATVAV